MRIAALGLGFRALHLIFFMVWVRVKVICGYDVMSNMSRAVRIKLQTVLWKFSHTDLTRVRTTYGSLFIFVSEIFHTGVCCLARPPAHV